MFKLRTVAEERGNSAADVGVGGEASASVDPVAKTPPSSPSHSSSVASEDNGIAKYYWNLKAALLLLLQCM